jgi:hypothetical protein
MPTAPAWTAEADRSEDAHSWIDKTNILRFLNLPVFSDIASYSVLVQFGGSIRKFCGFHVILWVHCHRTTHSSERFVRNHLDKRKLSCTV